MDDNVVEHVGSDRIARRTLLAGLVGTAAAAVAIPRVAVAAQRDSSSSTKAASSPQVRELTLYAVALPNGDYAYGHTPETASVPGPTIELVEGDTVRITVHNTTDRELSLHAHGVDYTIENDGTPQTGSAIAPFGQRTYVWHSHTDTTNPDGTFTTGSAGYWQYHDHAMGTHHGTEGVLKGLYGAVVVRRAGDALPDRQNVVVINDRGINNRTNPNTPTFTARAGERVEWIVITHGNLFHTFSLYGHRWADNRTGLISGPDDSSRVIDTRTSGPGDSYGFQVVAGERVGPGRWEYRTHNQIQADRGFFGFFEVLDELPQIAITGIAADQVYGDSLDKVISWTVSGSTATGKSTATLDGKPLTNGATVPLHTLALGQHVLEIVAEGTGGDATARLVFTTRTSFADVDTLVERFLDDRRISATAASSLLDRLLRAKEQAAVGSEKGAIGLLEQFVSRVQNQVRNDAEVRAVLVRDAQALIAELRALDEAENGR